MAGMQIKTNIIPARRIRRCSPQARLVAVRYLNGLFTGKPTPVPCLASMQMSCVWLLRLNRIRRA
jgi:hypothetical protein